MFTGIIECIGKILTIESSGTNKTFLVSSSVSSELKVDQSVSHDGVCLTVEAVEGDKHRVTAVKETLEKSDLGLWKTGSLVNIERCMLMNGRIDGHIVQGHVDTTAICLEKKDLDGSWQYKFEFPKEFSHLVIEKGSISINGASLTIFNVKKRKFDVAIIPYTYEHTNIQSVVPGTQVNIEFDLIGKYVSRLLQRNLPE